MTIQRNSKAPKAKAVAYLRTSSAANVGSDKDSDKRQRQAIEAFAKRASFELVGEFNDAAVSGADHLDARPGFAELLAYIASNGARTVIVRPPGSRETLWSKRSASPSSRPWASPPSHS